MDKQNRKAMLISIGIHLLVLILLFNLIAWQEPDPPLPEYGIELAMGFEETGFGNTPDPVPEPTQTRQEQSQEPQDEEMREPNDPVENEPVEEAPEAEAVEKPGEDTPAEVTQEAPANVSSQPEEKEKEQKKEETKPKKKPKPTIDGRALYPGKSTGGKGKDNTQGAAGKPNQENSGSNVSGSPGEAEGASLEMSGWNWDTYPRPNDNSDASGVIVLDFGVDADGYVQSVRVSSSTVVDNSVVQVYVDAVEQLTFSRTSGNPDNARSANGRITFVLRAK